MAYHARCVRCPGWTAVHGHYAIRCEKLQQADAPRRLDGRRCRETENILQNRRLSAMIVGKRSDADEAAYTIYEMGADGVPHRLRRTGVLRHILHGRHAPALCEQAVLRAGASVVRLCHRLSADAGDELDRAGAPPRVAEAVPPKAPEKRRRHPALRQHPAGGGRGNSAGVSADERADPPAGGQRDHAYQQCRGILLQGVQLGGRPAGQ